MALSFVCIMAVFFRICSGAALDYKECLTTLSDVHAKSDLDINKFAGDWFIHSTTNYVFLDKAWDSKTTSLYVNGDEQISVVTSGHQDGSDVCKVVVMYLHKDAVGVYSGPVRGHTFLIKVLYTNEDYTTVAMFLCFNANKDGSCEHGSEQIELWSRKLDDLTEKEEADLTDHVEKIDCIDIHDLHVMNQGTCETPSSADHASGIHVCEPPSADSPETTDSCKCNPADEKSDLSSTRPKGDWQSIIVAVDEHETATATSYKFIPGTQENSLYVLRSHQSGDTCSESTVNKFQRLSEHHYLQMFSSKPEEIWVFPAENNKLGIFTCSERYRGSCKKGSSQIELLSKTNDSAPISMEAFEIFMSKLKGKFCTNYKYFADQKAGVCAPSDIQGTIVSITDRLHYAPMPTPPKASLVPKQGCRLADIPLQASFKIAQLDGIWYEIAKSISSRKGFESGAEYYGMKDDNTVHSSYSGAEDNTCTPAIAGDIRQSKESSGSGDLQMRLHGPPDIFDWVPLKIVYNDGMYAMNYECYTQSPPGNCVKGRTSILGRQPKIDEYTKQKLYAMLPSLCLSAYQMVELAHNTDCSYLAIPHKDKTEPHHCHVNEIPVQNKVSMELMLGNWYIAAGKNSDTSLLEIRRNGATFVADAYAKRDGTCSKVSTEAFTQYDTEKNGDFLLSPCDRDVSPFFSMKIISTDYRVAVIYICMEEDHDGDCTPSGTRTFIMSRKEVISTLQLSTLSSQLKLSCEDLSDLHPVQEHCQPSKRCPVSDIPVMQNLDKQKLTGIWYDNMRHTKFMDADSGTLKVTLDNHGHLHMEYTALGKDGTCWKPKKTELRQRHNKVDGEFLSTQMAVTDNWGFVTVKVLAADYEIAMVLYVCVHIDDKGECAEEGKRSRIMSRSKTLAEEEKNKMKTYLDSACVTDIKETKHDVDCAHMLT